MGKIIGMNTFLTSVENRLAFDGSKGTRVCTKELNFNM